MTTNKPTAIELADAMRMAADLASANKLADALEDSAEFLRPTRPIDSDVLHQAATLLRDQACEIADASSMNQLLSAEIDKQAEMLDCKTKQTDELAALVEKQAAEIAELSDSLTQEEEESAMLSKSVAKLVKEREQQAAEIEALKAERDDLSERLSDFIDDFRMVIGEECPPDVRHCTCVPHLRKHQRTQAERIAELEKERDELERSRDFYKADAAMCRRSIKEQSQ